MKRIYIIFLVSLFASTMFAQAPEKMSYQAVVRDANSVLIVDQAVGLQISILQGSSTGTAVFTEIHTPTTNANGLLTVEIGTGSSQVGSIAAIDWGNGPYFLKSEIDITGGTNYSIVGTSQMLSVPYSFYAKTAGNLLIPISIDDLLDGISDGSSVFLGDGAGVNDDGLNRENVGFGINALESSTIGSENTAIGFSSLKENTHGFKNTSVGHISLNNNTVGHRNTAVGRTSLFTNIDGYKNSAFGAGSLHLNSIGYQNTAIGYCALRDNTTGNYNTALGLEANRYNEEGSNNTILGYEAGKGVAVHNKSGNVFLGYQSGYNELGDNKLYIENSNSTTPLIYGEFDNDLLRINGTLDINNEYQFPTVDGAGGQVLQTDGNGVLTWVASSNGGVQEIDDLLDGITFTSSVFLGFGTGVNDNGGVNNKNVGVGIDALHSNTSGYFNNANGYKALYSNTTGYGNTATGCEALRDNLEGCYNTAFGISTLTLNISGVKNTAIGTGALNGCTSGSHNVAVGHGSLNNPTTADNNVAIGSWAGQVTSTGENNTFVGFKSSGLNTTGSNNTTIGYTANQQNFTGSNNTIIGYMAGFGLDGSYHEKSGNVFIGYKAGRYELGDNKLYIENSNSATPLIYGEFDNDLITINGNLGVGANTFGGGSYSLAFNSGVIPTSSITNGVLLYSEMVSSSSELQVRDEAGNITTLSPHNFSLTKKSEDMAWSYFSRNADLDMEINVDMLKAIRLIEDFTGEKLVFIEDGKEDAKATIEESSFGVIELQQNEIDKLKKENSELQNQLDLIMKRLDRLEE